MEQCSEDSALEHPVADLGYGLARMFVGYQHSLDLQCVRPSSTTWQIAPEWLLSKTVGQGEVSPNSDVDDRSPGDFRQMGSSICCSQSWEIELGYREMKPGVLTSHYTLRSVPPEMIEEEFWDVL